MANALDLFLTAAAATYNVPEPLPKPVKAVKTPKASKVEGPKRPVGRPRKDSASPTSQAVSSSEPAAPVVNPFAGIEVGSLSPRDFIEALLNAGKKDPAQYQWDQKKAIHAFCGYCHSESFGVQLDNASRRAKVAIHGLGVEKKPNPAITVAGYVKGMPNNVERQRQDLEGRLNLAITTKRENLVKAGDKSLRIEIRKSWAAQAGLEESRIQSIRTQLRAIGF